MVVGQLFEGTFHIQQRRFQDGKDGRWVLHGGLTSWVRPKGSVKMMHFKGILGSKMK